MMTISQHPAVINLQIIRMTFHWTGKQSNAAQQTRKAAGSEKANINMSLLTESKQRVIRTDGF